MKLVSKLFTALVLANLTIAVYADDAKTPEAATKSLYAKTTDALKAAKDGVMTAKDTVVTKTVEAANYANTNRVQVSIATAAVALTVGAIYYVAYQAGKNAEAKRRAKADKQQAAVCCNN